MRAPYQGVEPALLAVDVPTGHRHQRLLVLALKVALGQSGRWSVKGGVVERRSLPIKIYLHISLEKETGPENNNDYKRKEKREKESSHTTKIH